MMSALLVRDGGPTCHLVPSCSNCARTHLPHVPVSVVVANREFEAWFLAGFRRMRSKAKFVRTYRFEENFQCELPRDCKGRVAGCLGRAYSETADQKDLVRHLGFGSYMGWYSRSFRKLLKDLDWLAKQARLNTPFQPRRGLLNLKTQNVP